MWRLPWGNLYHAPNVMPFVSYRISDAVDAPAVCLSIHLVPVKIEETQYVPMEMCERWHLISQQTRATMLGTII